MFHISTASSGKRIHSSSKFTCHLETYSGQSSNFLLNNTHHPALRMPGTSIPCSNTSVLPKQTILLWMLLLFPPSVTHHLQWPLLASMHTNKRSLSQNTASTVYIQAVRFTSQCCFYMSCACCQPDLMFLSLSFPGHLHSSTLASPLQTKGVSILHFPWWMRSMFPLKQHPIPSSNQYEPLPYVGGCQEVPGDYNACLEISYFNKSQISLDWQDIFKASQAL